ncbi:hypothetical protein QUF90_22005 [Desulfococcaceae bacterium HSG9]|nr:hypothetical protein [Desulfococcaceae bacterium HSG9]
MKKILIIKFLIFVSILILLDNILYTFINKIYEKSSYNQVCIIKKIKPDILFLGTSRSQHAIIPNIIEKYTGLNGYNLAWDNAGLIWSKGILSVLTKWYSPKIIVVEIMPEFNGKEPVSRLGPYFFIEEVKELLDYYPISKRYKYSIFKTSRYESKLASLLKRLFIKYEHQFYGYIPKYNKMGINMQLSSSKAKNSVDNKIGTAELKKDTVSLIKNIVNTAKSSSSDIIFVQIPTFKNIHLRSEQIYKKISILNEIVFLGSFGFDERTLALSREDFFDATHMNHSGAKKFSKYLANQILLHENFKKRH